jgi:hypothetical protein
MVARTVAAADVFITYAPPVIVFLQAPHDHTPAAARFTDWKIDKRKKSFFFFFFLCVSKNSFPFLANFLHLTHQLAAKIALVLGTLRDFHLLRLLTERRTVTSAVLAHDADLLSALGHFSVLFFSVK